MTSPLTSGQQEQLAARDLLVETTIIPVGKAFTRDAETARAMKDASQGECSRFAITAAIGYLVENGLVTVTPDWPAFLPMRVSEHLQPPIPGGGWQELGWTTDPGRQTSGG